MSNLSAIIFDLDGTLVDSSPSILSSLQESFKQTNISPEFPITSNLIGPPLDHIISTVAPSCTLDQSNLLISTFKEIYDHQGVFSTNLYPGINLVLKSLSTLGLPLFIVTNKRHSPAIIIVSHLGLI